jgi:type I restriction enzyme M protein
MESCLLICRTNKKKERKNKVLFINAVNEVRQEKSISYLDETHIQKIYQAFKEFKSSNGFCSVVDSDKVLKNNGNLNITLYVDSPIEATENAQSLEAMLKDWEISSNELKSSVKSLISELKS